MGAVLGCQPFDQPIRILLQSVDETVVETTGAPLPKLKAFGLYGIATPEIG